MAVASLNPFDLASLDIRTSAAMDARHQDQCRNGCRYGEPAKYFGLRNHRH